MSLAIEYPRHLCTLGAQQSVLAINRAVPIVHAGPGCSSKLFSGLSFCNGFQGSGYIGGNAIPCTNSGEREVVFGGEESLRRVIDGTLKVIDGDFFVVLTGCTSDIVGDDIASIVGDYKAEGIPIVYAETGGFKGSSYLGHELILKAIIEQYLKPSAEKIKGLVNVFTVLPYLDPFWNGNLEEIKKLLEGLGLEVNIIFGSESDGLAGINKIPQAQFNLLISPWVGLEAVKLLEERFETPFLHYKTLPIGAVETSKFLSAVADFAGLEKEKSDNYIASQEKNYYYYLEKSADFLLEFRYDLPGRFFTIADSFYTLGISKFLVNDLGFLPGKQFVTDDTPEEYREDLIREFQNLSDNVSSKISFLTDGSEIHNQLREYNHKHQPLIIGSTWERDIAKELNGFYLGVSLPVTEMLVLDRAFVGYKGGLRLIEDLYASVLGSYQ